MSIESISYIINTLYAIFAMTLIIFMVPGFAMLEAGIVRTKKELKDALNKIESYLLLDVGRLLYLRLLTAKTILKASLKREKSLGAHFIKED